MTGHEHFMYQVLGKISEADGPIVFKGALMIPLESPLYTLPVPKS